MVVEHDLRCVKCGYNLRGLVESGVCPECATSIQRSLLASRKPRLNWTRLVACLAVAYGLVFVYATIASQGYPLLVFFLDEPIYDPLANPGALLLLITTLAGVALWRVVPLVLPAPWWRRRLCEIFVVVCMILYGVLLGYNAVESERFPRLTLWLLMIWPAPLFASLGVCWLCKGRFTR